MKNMNAMSQSKPLETSYITPAMIRTMLESTMEAYEPQTSIRAYLAAREGKKLTKADEPKLRAAAKDDSIRIVKIARMTNIEWGGYGREQGNKGGSVLVAYTDGAPTIVMADFDRQNVAYFQAAEERNASRRVALADDLAIQRLANHLNQKIVTERALASLLGYGSLFDVIRFEMGKEYKAIADSLDMWTGA